MGITAPKSSRPVAETSGLSLALRNYVFLTAAVCGAAVMIVEILGAKMLSPYLGLSHFVWTAQIAVTLVALACGYYAGGRVADNSRRLAVLYWAVLGAAVYLGLTVVICEPVAYWCLDFSSLALASLLASAILFFIPLALLAMTSPFLVRFITASLEGVSSNVGRLSSVSTLGSFGGTLLIGYFMVPFLPNSITMYATAMTLMLVCIGFFAGFGTKPEAGGPNVRRPVQINSLGTFAGALLTGYITGSHSPNTIPAPIGWIGWMVWMVWWAWIGFFVAFRPKGIVPAFLVALLFLVAVCRDETPHYTGVQQVFSGNSHFGQLQVLDRKDGSERFYLNDYLVQNTYDPATKQSMSHFTYALAGLARVNVTNITDVLCIGLGVGIVPMDFAHCGARVDVVEINPAVVPVAMRFFNLQTNLIHLTIDDGRHYLNRCQKQYDAVILDAFLGDSSPSHLMTREAFSSIHRVLRPGGALVINSFGNLQPGRDFFTASLDRTLKTVFRTVRMHTSGDGGMFFAATDRVEPGFVHPPDFEGVHSHALRDMREIYANIVEVPSDHGLVLTDNYNPTEFYDARNREEIRRRLAMGARPD